LEALGVKLGAKIEGLFDSAKTQLAFANKSLFSLGSLTFAIATCDLARD
jgi:hypothetical protein